MSKHIDIDLSREWDYCMEAAARLEPHLKAKRKSSYADWCKDGNFAVSCPAEMAFGLYIGERPNFDLLTGGDGGYDFRSVRVDVKGTPYWSEPALLIPPHQKKKVVPGGRYVLVAVNSRMKVGRIFGFATGAEILAKPEGFWAATKQVTTYFSCKSLHDIRGIREEVSA